MKVQKRIVLIRQGLQQTKYRDKVFDFQATMQGLKLKVIQLSSPLGKWGRVIKLHKTTTCEPCDNALGRIFLHAFIIQNQWNVI